MSDCTIVTVMEGVEVGGQWWLRRQVYAIEFSHLVCATHFLRFFDHCGWRKRVYALSMW